MLDVCPLYEEDLPKGHLAQSYEAEWWMPDLGDAAPHPVWPKPGANFASFRRG